MEKRYGITRTRGEPDWADIPRAQVDCACWGTTYTPETTFQCAYQPGKTLYIRMECHEAEPWPAAGSRTEGCGLTAAWRPSWPRRGRGAI